MTAVTNGGCRTVTTLPLPPDYKSYAYSGWDFVNRRACHVSSNETENGYSASLQKGWHLEVPNDKSEMVEATPEQIDEMLSP
jgi:hypothetical protein